MRTFQDVRRLIDYLKNLPKPVTTEDKAVAEAIRARVRARRNTEPSRA